MQVDNDGTIVSQGQGGGDSSSSSGGGAGSSVEDGAATGGAQPPAQQSAGPVIDEDGFQLVQSRRPSGRAGQGG